MKHCVVNVTEFKARCLALLEEMNQQGGTITVTKRGRAFARVEPAHDARWKSPEGLWKGKVRIVRDPLDVDTSDLWTVAGDDPEGQD